MRQAQQKINKIQDGWEKDIYTEEEAVDKVKELRQMITDAEQEIENINSSYKRENFNLDSLRQELLSLRSQNLEEASFEEKAELVARLGVKVVPAEDLKTRRICCRLNLDNTQKKGGENVLTKVTFGGAGVTIGITFFAEFMIL